MIQGAYFRLKNLALDLGVLRGHSNYNKFIILGEARSGSNFLRGLLNSHNQVVVFGELFRSQDSIGWELPEYDRYLQSRSLISLIQTDPVRFLETKVFKKFPRQISAVGFKMFYYHAQDDHHRAVWTFLRNQKDLKVIHLKRNNSLRVLLSLKKAFMTNRWTDTLGIKDDNQVVSLDYEECLRHFTWAQEIKERYDAFFKDHQKIDVFYERLSDHYESEMKLIQEFLGVSYEVLKPSTFKQSTQPLSKSIGNYSELKGKFKGTPWEEFFKE